MSGMGRGSGVGVSDGRDDPCMNSAPPSRPLNPCAREKLTGGTKVSASGRWRAGFAGAMMRREGEFRVPEAAAETRDQVVIKKYANRRLYNTDSSTYVTLEHLSDMVKRGTEFVVYDAKTNEDITRSVLTQIIFEQEGRQGQSLLPVAFLRQLIGYYGNSLQGFVPGYLEMSLNSFGKQQEKLREQMAGALAGTPAAMGAHFFEEQVRQNMALFDRAMKMFSPFGTTPTREEPSAPAEPDSAKPAEGDLSDMKRQLEAMQAQIEALAAKP
jgi:polyhydroxyalkanoate synthesis repressor PhaR